MRNRKPVRSCRADEPRAVLHAAGIPAFNVWTLENLPPYVERLPGAKGLAGPQRERLAAELAALAGLGHEAAYRLLWPG